MKTRLSRQLEGPASRESSDSARMFNSYKLYITLSTFLIFSCADTHPLQWKSLISTPRSTLTESTYFCGSRMYEAKLKAWAFDLAKLMSTPCCAFRESPWKPANHGILFNVRLWLRIFRQLQAKGSPLSSNFSRYSIRHHACRRRAV